jgi:DNA polymerase-3 subunit epsilon
MLAGHSIDPDEVAGLIAPAALIIAYNASLDRRFAEAFCPAFAETPRACSLSGDDCAAEGFKGSKRGAKQESPSPAALRRPARRHR